MNEKQIKEFYKWLVENSQKQVSHESKELIKQAIDASQNYGDLILTAISYMRMQR